MFVFDRERETPGGGAGWLVSPDEELVVYVTACTKPDCDCDEVFVHAARLDDDGTIGKSLAWLGAAKAEGRPDLVAELRGLPKSVSEQAREIVADRRHQATYRVPRAVMRSNDLVNWLDYHSRSGSIFSDGDTYVPIEVDGIHYAVDLAFCPRPACDCRRALLRVMRIEERDDTFRGWEGEAIPLDLDGQPRWSDNIGDRALATQIHRAWLEQGDAATLVSSRYRTMKEVGARSTPAPAPARRPARNAACPCGSGRRYKACCGRR